MVERREIIQAGYVVADIDAAMSNWMQVAGIGPFRAT
jgi:23S rRNA U2552 (ribose-2'-O)-methylase RlmE/FtsJ